MPCAPQRFLANDRNVVREAALDPSSVLPVDDQVLSIPVARRGTAEVRLTGPYAGVEEATIDVEILDTTPAVPVITAPISAGAGSSRLVNIAATGLPAQTIIVELTDAGAPATYAAVSFEGVRLKARTIGAGGNTLRLAIDQTGITVAATAVAALVQDLRAGQGGPSSGIEGADLDWSTAVLGADNLIPLTAKRVSFGDDRSTIYLAYKRYVDTRWLYHFVPELKRDVPKGTPVYFVTGGRTVTVTDGATTETYNGIITVYDILIQLRNSSALIEVDGVVTNDRAPTGQASRELLVRTDAHVLPSVGVGSVHAREGFINTFANANAITELVEARCYAVTGKDHPLARLGVERWEVYTSLGGLIGEAVTGVPFVDPLARFGFTIKQKLPAGYGTQRGRFTWIEDRPVPRADGEPEMPPNCPVSMMLGSEAVDQTITLTWTQRPSGDCDCSHLPAPRIGGRCLGIIETTEGEDDMSYSPDAILRLKALYDWGNELASAVASYTAGWEQDGIPRSYETTTGNIAGSQPYDADSNFNISLPLTATPPAEQAPFPGVVNIRSLQLPEVTTFADDVTTQVKDVLDDYETGIMLIDEVEDTGLLADGWAQWDLALQQFIDDFSGTSNIANRLKNLTVEKYKILVRQAVAYAGVSPLGKSDASADVSGDGCWRDRGDNFYFAVEGSEKGGYAPLFPNEPYYSSRRATKEDKYFATHEFGFQLNIVEGCLSRMKVSDQIIFSIGDAGWGPTYQNGDTITMPVIAASDLYLAGGRDDNSTQTWSVNGSDFGPFPPWLFIPGSSGTDYSQNGLSFDIEPGGIPNQKGDRFTFAIEGGHYRWRKNAGAWSGSLGIPVGAVVLTDGLSIQFVPGAAPAFYPGDLFSFLALQPNAVSNVRIGYPDKWRWADESPGVSLDLDLLTTKDLDTVALALHTIPAGATLTLSGGPTAAANAWTEPITWQSFLIVQPLSVTRSARYLRLDIVNGGGGGIGWLWAGMALSTQYPADVQFRRRVRVLRGGAPLSQGGSSLASARGATVTYQKAGINQADMLSLAGMFEWTKPAGGEIEPIILVPEIGRPEEAVIGEIEEDELVFEEQSGEQRTDGPARRYHTNFAVGGLWNR